MLSFRTLSQIPSLGLLVLTMVVSLVATCHAQELGPGFLNRLADSSATLAQDRVTYDPSYFRIPYPNGDVPAGKGVCTDVVVRGYRKVGIDLQREVHEDMRSAFDSYPALWGLSKPDSNIDHRRVPNLMTYFRRRGAALTITQKGRDYRPGDVVAWDLGGGIKHIGLVTAQKVHGTDRHYIVHNIGSGQVLEDMLFAFRIIGHYRYAP